ncbi:MAG: hypothetical protein H6838_10690 [Planctomycetes bacterium]|nr:hypothetical protein [Planctomycetota bacterium]MCB9885953.1 hypothetical protein [Planctomycetota bacterium]
MRSIRFLVGFFLFGMAVARAQEPPASPAAPKETAAPLVLFDFEARDASRHFRAVTKSAIGPRPAPALIDGAAAMAPLPGGTALRIQGFARTFVYAVDGHVPADLRPYSELRLWVHRSADEVARHATTEVELQFVEEEGVRYWRKVVLDQTGWQAIQLPLRWFSPAGGRLPRWDRIRTFGIYFRGPGEVLLDGIALVPGTGPFLEPERDLRTLAFGADAPVVRIDREHSWLMSDVQGHDGELRELADELAGLQRRVLTDFALPLPMQPAGILVFAKDATYRAFPPRLAEQLARNAGAPRSDGYTLLGIATSSADAELGLRRPVLVHEFVHSVLEQSARLGAGPDWFHEGVAAYYQNELRPQAGLAELIAHDYVDTVPKVRPIDVAGPKARFGGQYILGLTMVATLLSEPYRAKVPALVTAFQAAKSTALGPQLGPVLQTDWEGFEAQWARTCERLAGR